MKTDVLQDQLEKITMMELRIQLGKVMQQVELGKTFILVSGIKRRPIAVIQKPPAGLTMVIDSAGHVDYSL